MAEMRRAIDKVCLTLEETDAIVELGDHVQLLICGSIASSNEWGVVSSHFCDVAVRALTKLDKVIAWSRVCGLWARART
jgi:hypothetical protein